MRPTACLTLLTPLLKKRSFTSKEARALGVTSSVLSHYVKTGKLKRIGRGLYQGADYDNPPPTRWDDLAEAIHSIPGEGVACLVSALAIYDLTEELPRQHWIGIRHGTTARNTRQIKSVRFRNLNLGKTEIEIEGVFIPIFDRERTIVDAFRLLSRETAIKALKAAVAKGGKNRLNFVKLESYAKKLRFDITPYLLSVTT